MWRLACVLIVSVMGSACTPLSVHSGSEQIKLGVVRSVELSTDSAHKPAPTLAFCFDYRINFSLENFKNKHRVAAARFVTDGDGSDKGLWPTFGGIDIYDKTPLFTDKNGWFVYYACGGPNYGPPSLTPFMKERFTTGLSLADWVEIAQRKPDTSLEGLGAIKYTVEKQITFMKMVEQVFKDGKIKTSPIFLRYGWFPRYIEFPEVELIVNVDLLLSARGVNHKLDCTSYRIVLKECIPEWALKEMRE